MTHRTAARVMVPMLLILLAFLGISSRVPARAAAAPPSGAYQEPAPEAPNEKHATDFVNELLKDRGTKARVETPDLRGGLVLPTQPNRTEKRSRAQPDTPPAPPPPRKDPAKTGRYLPSPDTGPAERAGVGSPVNQDVDGMLVAVVVGVILAAVGVVLEVANRRRRKT